MVARRTLSSGSDGISARERRPKLNSAAHFCFPLFREEVMASSEAERIKLSKVANEVT